MFDDIRRSLAAYEPLLIPMCDGRLRAIEKGGLIVCDVKRECLPNRGSVASRLREAFESAAREREPVVDLSINVVVESLAVDRAGDALALAARLLREHALARISMHFSEPVSDLSRVVSFCAALRESLGNSQPVEIRLNGPFGPADGAQLEALLDRGVLVTFAAGWFPGDWNNGREPVDRRALLQFSEAGFRTVVAWYVHSGNMDGIEDLMHGLLRVNYWSGFSLPLVAASPYYRFGNGYPGLPSAAGYCDLLVRCYREFPDYDQVMSPLFDIARIARFGGWNSSLGVPAAVDLIVDGIGDIGIYRYSPAVSQRWLHVDELLRLGPDRASDAFLEFVRETWQWERNPYCSGCEWRHVCGGLDGFSDNCLGIASKDTFCAHRKLFLQHFFLSRGADFEFGGETAAVAGQ